MKNRDVVIDFTNEAKSNIESEPLLGGDDEPTQESIAVDIYTTSDHDDTLAADPLEAADRNAAEERSFMSKIGAGLKYASFYIIAAIAASPTAFSALVGPSGQGPEKIGSEWWNAMSIARRILCVACGVSSEAVNTIMNALFIPVAFDKIKASLADIGIPAQAAKSIAALLLGIGGGIAAGALSYSSFLWLPVAVLSAIPSTIAFLITFASRFIGIKNIFNRVSNLLNANVRLQKVFADKLAHLNDNHLDEAEAKLKAIITETFPDKKPDEPLTEAEYQSVIEKLAEQLNAMDDLYDDLIKDTTTTEMLLKYSGLVIDLITAISILTPAYMTFSQKGFDGVNIISKLTTGTALTDLHPAAKAGIGAAPGLASAMFYTSAGMDFRGNMVETFKHLYQHPASIPGALGLFAANAFASFSMSSVAQAVIDKPDNIYNLANNAYGTTYLATQTAGGLIVNLNSCVVKAYLNKPEPAAKDVTLAHLAKRTSGEDHPISDDTATALRQFNLFAPKAAQHTPVQVPNIGSGLVLEV